ncbi:MAG TPA: phytoene desaturase family protein [Clostridiales bacterium]|nr:phytoene desaturase family protein [Clostridiales bacterium]HQP70487.1 phytoene desaturase family protein [Clostridiales bacterium]
MNKKVIIVGAGPGGLSAGMLLASKGYNVHIYEKKNEVGGRNSFFRLGNYTFDIGPTFFMMKDVLEAVFEKSGKKLEDFVESVRLDPMYRLKFADGRELYPSPDKAKMKETMEKFFPGSFDGYLKYLEKEKIKYDKLIPCLSIPYGKLSDFFSMHLIKALPYLDAHTSLYGVLSRYFDDPDTRIAFTFQAKYIGMSPWTAPGTFSIISFIEHGGGIYHITGGLNKLSHGMAEAFKQLGGNIHLSSPVKKLIVENGKATGVELDGGKTDMADYIVVNEDFAYAMTEIVPKENRKKWTDENLASKGYSCSTFMLYLGVKKEYKDIAHHSIIFAKDYKKNVDEITEEMKLSDDFSFYVQNASVTDKTLAPEGKSAIYVLVPVPNNKSGIDWEKEKSAFRNRILEALEIRGGYEGIRQNIEEEKIVTPADWENEHSVYLGATFNLAHNVGQMLYFRPHNEFEEFKSCYLVGGGTHPGSGLPTIYESGRISAELIMKKDGIKP